MRNCAHKDVIADMKLCTEEKLDCFESCITYCFPKVRRPCWICISLWHSSLYLYCLGRKSSVDPSSAPPVVPWCCYTMLGFDRGFYSVRGIVEDSSVGVYSKSVPVSPRPAFFSHGRYPRLRKWRKVSSEWRSWGEGQTEKLCPNASFSLHLVARAGEGCQYGHLKSNLCFNLLGSQC